MPNSSVKAKVEALIGEIGSNDTTVVSEWASDTAREVINILPEDMLWSVSTELSDSAGGSGAKITISFTDGVITSASIRVDGPVTSITVTSAGSGYPAAATTVIITGGGGTGATATTSPHPQTGAISSVTVTNGGSGYTSAPTITFSSELGGSGAVATSTITTNTTHGGSGYLDDPVLTISGGTGIGGTVRGFSNGSAIIAVDVLTGGSGYDGTEVVAVSSSNGVDVSTSKFLYAHKNGYEAIEITPSMKGRASDTASIYKATDSNPVYFREGGKVTILPTGGKVAVVSFPTILYDHADVTGVPDDVKHLVIMGTAVKGRLNQLNDLRVAIKEISNPSYVIPNMAFDGSPDIADLVVSANVPSLVMSSAPSISPLDIQANSPTAPPSPSFIYSDVSDSETIGATTIVEPSLSSPYISPTMEIGAFPPLSWDIGSLPVCPYYNWDTIDEVLSSMVIPSGVVLPILSISVAPTLTWDMPSPPVRPTISEKVVADFTSSYPNYVPPLMDTPNWTDTNTWISTEEDNEMLAARVQEINAKISEYSARLQESQAAFNKDNSIFQAVVQEKVQEAQLSDANVAKTIQLYQNDVQKYSAKVNTVIQENQSRFQVWQIEWSTKLQKYQADLGVVVNKYQSEIAAENQLSKSKVEVRANQLKEDSTKNTADIQRFQAKVTSFQADVASVAQVNQGKITAWQTEIQTNLQKYTTDIQNSLNNFNSSNVEFQASVNFASENAKMKQERIISELKIQQDASKQNALQKLQKEVQEYSNALSRYGAEVQDYQSRVSTEIQEWTTNNLQHSLAKWNTERSTEIQKYSADLQKFSAESQNEQQIYAINEIQKEIQLYSTNQANKLGKFQSDIQNSTQQFQSEFGIYTKKTDSEFQKHQTMMQELQLLQQQYQQGLQMFIQSYTAPKGVEESVK